MSGIELGTAFLSVSARTDKLASDIQAGLKGATKHADTAGTDLGQRLAKSASKAMKDGWKPDQDIMAGIPNTKLDRVGARIGQLIGKGAVAGMRAQEAGQKFATSFGAGASSIGIGRVIRDWNADAGKAGSKIGYTAGKALSAGLQTAAAGGLGLLALSLSKGFDRLKSIDSAKYKLQGLGMSAEDIAKTVQTVTDAVTGTPFSMDSAFKTATQAIGANVTDLKRFMTDVSDAAGFAGTDLDRMGLIFNQVLAKGKLTGEEMMQLAETGLPAKSWIEDSFHLTSDQFDKMQAKGEITMEMLQKSIEDHAGGMSKKLGDTLQGSIDNMQTAIARVGADFLSVIFGGGTGDPAEGMKQAIQRITEKLNELDGWVKSHGPQIHQFFTQAADVAKKLLDVLGKIAEALTKHPALIEAAAGVFVAKWTIGLVAPLLTGLASVSTALGLLPGAAATSAGGISAALAGVSVPAWLALLAAGAGFAGSDLLGRGQNVPTLGSDGTIFDPLAPGGQGGVLPGNSGPWAPNSLGGDSNAQRQRRGLNPIDPTGGLLGGTAAPASANIPAAGGKQGIANMIVQSALNRGYSIDESRSILAYSIGESGLNPGISGGVQGDDEVIGLFQQKSAFAREGGINPRQRADPQSNINAYLNHLDRNRGAGDMAHQLFATSVGGPFYTGGYGAMKSLESQAQQYISKMGYDSGGVLPPGMTLANNQTGKPEAVFTSQQLQDMRTNGAIPAGAGSQGKAGDSTVAKAIGIGGEVINGIIDQAASAASSAASIGVSAVAPGAGGLAGGAAASAIGLGTNAAKRGITYGFDEAGILADSILQQFTPFGMPRWLSTDPKSFMPQWDPQGALGNLMTAGTQAAMGNGVDPNTTQHGTGNGAAPGPDLFANQADSFLSTQPLHADAPMPGSQQPAVHMENVYTNSNEELARETVKRQQLAAMQYTGRPTGR